MAEAAVLAEAILAPWGLSLVEAARLAAGIKERESASRSLGDAGKVWLAACEGLRPRTLESYGALVKRLEKSLGERLLSTITSDELQDAIAPLGTTGASAHCRIRTAGAFWRWCAGKGWCDASVFDGVETPKGRTETEIEVLTPEEAEALMRTAETHFPQAVASFALQLFAGIRAEEIKRLESCHVTKDGIELPKTVAKKNRRRHITPNPALASWLEKYPFEPCPNWKETSNACRRLTGWAVESRLLSDPPKPTRGAWPQNALRHSHASYAVGSGVPLEALLFEFGHSGTPALLRSNYVGRVTKKASLAFFAIRPTGNDAEVTTLESVA